MSAAETIPPGPPGRTTGPMGAMPVSTVTAPGPATAMPTLAAPLPAPGTAGAPLVPGEDLLARLAAVEAVVNAAREEAERTVRSARRRTGWRGVVFAGGGVVALAAVAAIMPTRIELLPVILGAILIHAIAIVVLFRRA